VLELGHHRRRVLVLGRLESPRHRVSARGLVPRPVVANAKNGEPVSRED
jgi:hypothetical protein